MNLSCNPNDFRVPVSGKRAKPLRLAELPTGIDKLYKSKKDYRQRMEEFSEELHDLQRVLYAHGRYALLLIFQGMDTAGKDGAIIIEALRALPLAYPEPDEKQLAEVKRVREVLKAEGSK